MDFDLLLRGGWVIDGSGGPASRADVGLLDTMIAAVGRLDAATAAQVVDLAGLTVVPGFIDAHVHGDLMLLADPVHLPALRQGVTTYILGQDGSSFAPASPATLDYMRRYTAGFNGNPPGLSYDWETIDDYLARFDRSGAIGLSTGLDYLPSLYADVREIAALCAPIVRENGVYVTHMRGYGPRADI